MSKDKEIKRDFETRYWIDSRRSRPITSGFPKREEGSAKGVSKIIMHGYASKVQCVDRHTEKVLWTAKAGPRIPGLHVRSVEFVPGDDEKPLRRKEGK